jgi:S-formylglutathione hydrolase FrmB
MEIKSNCKVFGGNLVRFSHNSIETKTSMTFAVFFPPSVFSSIQNSTLKIPSIVFLSGLTCTDENVCQKSGVFQKLAERNVSVLIFYLPF